MQNKAADFGEQPADFGDKAIGFGEQPTDFGDKAAGFGEQPADFGDKAAEFGEQPAASKKQPAVSPKQAQTTMPDITNRADRRTLFANALSERAVLLCVCCKNNIHAATCERVFGKTLFGTFCSLWQKIQEYIKLR